MRTILAIVLLFVFCAGSAPAQKLGTMLGGLTEKDAAAGIREALGTGASRAVDIVSKVDGYFANPEIKIPMPSDAAKVEKTLRRLGMGKKVDEAVLSMNRAAELAARSALPVFSKAITGMTITDALAIVRGDKTSATTYLRSAAGPGLIAAFTPIVADALRTVEATRYWKDVMTAYNKVPFTKKVNTDLTAYVTEKAVDGLFTMLAKEEVSIRTDPAARGTEILKKVFGR